MGSPKTGRPAPQQDGYLQGCGINMVHIHAYLKCPVGQSDGGYAVSDFRQIDERVGNTQHISPMAESFASARFPGWFMTSFESHLR